MEKSFQDILFPVTHIQNVRRYIAYQQEEAKLTEYHQYEDGGIDQPFLTPETAKDD